MSGYLVDTNVLSLILKGDVEMGEAVASTQSAIDSTIYIECLQGSKSSSEKSRIKRYLDAFPLFFISDRISRRAVDLIDRYSNSHGLLIADAQIAATCLEHKLGLLTRNSADFRFIDGLRLIEPIPDAVYEETAVAEVAETGVDEKLGFHINTDKSLLNLDTIHRFLSIDSYWAQTRTLEQTKKAIENSICFGVYDGQRQIGFARVVSDCATFAYIGDVFVIDEYRGRGLSKWLMEVIVSHPDLQNLRRWVLATRDAHGLYAQYDFNPLVHPDRWMERTAPDAY